MSSADLYIIAAGNGSRLKTNVPKALVQITDEPCLSSTLQQIGKKFRRVFIATNVCVCDQWNRYFEDLEAKFPELAGPIINLPIRSGLGDGHATLQALLSAEGVGDKLARDVVVAWGDVFFPHAEIIDELLSLDLKGAGLLPAVREVDPYVSLLVDDGMRCVAADFSKHGECHADGYHDQCVFRFNLGSLKRSLIELHNALWKNGRYLAPNGELSLLYSFHHLYNSKDPAYVYETAFPTLTFNTVEEVVAVQREISFRWRQRVGASSQWPAD